MSRIIVAGQVYVQALPPEKKRLKREYLLEQAQREDRIPSFEEVLEYYAVDADEFIGAEDDLHGAVDSFEEFEEEMLYQYDQAVALVSHGLAGADCWRGVSLPEQLDPVQHDGLGIYWAYNREGVLDAVAEGPGSPGKNFVVYHGEVDLKHVNKRGTIWAACAPGQGDIEYEVQFYQHAPIFVHDVQLEDGRLVTIDDWRQT